MGTAERNISKIFPGTQRCTPKVGTVQMLSQSLSGSANEGVPNTFFDRHPTRTELTYVQ